MEGVEEDNNGKVSPHAPHTNTPGPSCGTAAKLNTGRGVL
jgi:hypothetical protein